MSWLIRTKLCPPLLREEINRKHLRARLERAVKGGVKTIFLSAPAGYGKSTLLSQWLGSQKRDYCWYSFDLSDDAAVLSRHLAEGLRQIGLWEADSPNLEQILSILSNEDTSILFVLDDIHLNKDPLVHSFLEHLVNHISPNSSLILSSREAPQPYLTRFFPQESFQIWNARDLCLTKNETRKFLQLTGTRLKAESLNTLFEQTEGWPAAIRLLSLTNSRGRCSEALIRNLPGSQGCMWEYLANEILSALEPEVQCRVIRLSLLERFNRQVASSLDADLDLYVKPSWGPFLVELEDEPNPGWFRFHHLLGHFLRQHTELHLSKDERDRVHAKASIWFENHGYFEEAVQQSLAARELDRAQALLSSEDAIERITDHYSAAQHWFEVLPKQRINNSWLLCTNLGTVYGLLGRLSEAKDFFQRALDDESCEEVGLCLSGLAFCQAGLGQEKTGEEYLALALAQEHKGPSRSIAQLFIASVQLYRGDAYKALCDINNAIDASNSESIVVEASCALVKANALFYRGLLQESVQSIEQFLVRLQQAASAQKLKRLNDKSAAAWGLRARLTSQLGSWSEAEISWEKFEEARQAHGIPHFLPPLLCAKIRYLMRRGRLSAAREYLNHHLDDLGGRVGISLSRAVQAELLCEEGHADKALGLLREWMRELRVEGHASFFYHQRLTVAKAKCLLAPECQCQSSHEEVLVELDALTDRAAQDGRTWDLIHISWLSAELYAKAGDLARCHELVDKALAKGRPLGFVELFLTKSLAGEYAQSRDQVLYEWSSPLGQFKLEAREIEIVNLMKDGLSNQEIADRTFLGIHTVKWYNRRIFKKLGIKRRAQVARALDDFNE